MAAHHALPAGGSSSRTDLSRRGFTDTSLLAQADATNNASCRVLDLAHNKLTSLPSDFCPRLAGPATLQQLDLSHNKFASVPSALFFALKLVHLDLSHNALSSLLPSDGAEQSPGWQDLSVLQHLSLSGNELLADIGPLITPALISSLKILSLASCSPSLQLSSLESFVHLRSLDLSSLELTSIPQSLYSLSQLQLLYLNDNKLDCVPAALFQALPALRELQLARNCIQHLTPALAQFYHLRHLQGNPVIQAVEGNSAASSTQTIALLEGRVAEQQAAIDELRQQNGELVGQAQTQDSRVQQLQTRVELLGEKLLEAQRQVAEKEEVLGKELLAVRSELTSSKTDVERGDRDMAELKSARQQLDAERQRLETDNQRLANEKQQAEAEQQRLRAEKQQLESDCATLNAEKIAAQDEARTLRDENDRLCKLNEAAQGTQLDELQKLKESLKLSEQKRAKLSRELDTLKEELEDTNETLKTTSMINTSLEQALVCLREHQKQSETERADTTTKIESLEQENKSLRDQCAELQQRLDTELNGRRSPGPDVEDHSQVNSQADDQLSSRVTELEDLLASRQQEIVNLTKTFKDKLARKEEKISDWLGTIATLSQALQDKEAELETTQKALATAQERVAELEAASAQAASSSQRPRRSSFLNVPSARQFHAGSGRRDPNSPRLPPANEIQAELNIALTELEQLNKRITAKDEELLKANEELLNIERSKRSGGLSSIFSSTTPDEKKFLDLREKIVSLMHEVNNLQKENIDLKQRVAAIQAEQYAADSKT